MFRAVRLWWGDGHGKRTLRLLGFELTVVMIGVLAAQQISNWAQRRSALNEVESLQRNLYHSFGGYQVIAASYRAAIPCLDDRVDTILRMAGSKEDLDPRLLDGAHMILLSPDNISPDNAQLLRERYGNEIADKIDSFEFNVEKAGVVGRALETRWFEFQRINPQLGTVNNEDRSAARAAAVEIKGLLRSLDKSAEVMQRISSRLGVVTDPQFGLAPVASCDQIWRTGRAYLDHGK